MHQKKETNEIPKDTIKMRPLDTENHFELSLSIYLLFYDFSFVYVNI